MVSKNTLVFLILLIYVSTVRSQFLRAPTTFDEDIEELSRDLLGDEIDPTRIKIYSNFDTENDRRFFRTIFPWLADNIGQYLRVDYRFRNSGRNVGPRMCALRAMQRNTFMQSELLRCEADGSSIQDCVNRSGLNMRFHNRCVRERVNEYVRNSQLDFENLLADNTPTVLINRREASVSDPNRLLRLICQRYGRLKPAGCLSPTPFPTV